MKKTKTKIATIIFVLLLSVIPIITLLPTVNAANIPTYAFLSVAPNPVGVNQEVTILMWLDKINPTASGPAGSRFGDYSLTITKPNNDQETMGPYTADPASFAYVSYTPDQIGDYTIVFDFPGQQVTGIGGIVPVPVDNYYEPSSFTATLTVQSDPITASPQTPVPTDYWTRPIDAQNRDWHTISGNWLALGATTFGDTAYNLSGNFNPYTKAPRSPHIVWTKPLSFGGQIGGEFGGSSASVYYTGKSYEPKLTPAVIINGVLYYNEPLPPKNGYYAVDLRTGETIWHHDSYGPVTEVGATGLLGTPAYAGITCGQIFNYHSPNEIGARAYLWFAGSAGPAGAGLGATPYWYMYDAEEGDLIVEFQNATGGGTRVQGPIGELLFYYIGTDWIALWNSTKAIGTGTQFSTGLWTWRPPTGQVLDWNAGIQWNVTVPPVPGQAIASVGDGMIFATTGNFFVPFDWQMEVAYDMWTGEQLWIQNRTTPTGTTSFGMMSPISDGVYTQFDKGALQFRGFSAANGQQIWGPTEQRAGENAFASQPQGYHGAYGNLYQRSMDGIHAIDIQTGQRQWDFYADPTGLDYPGIANYPFLAADLTIADGIVFAATGNSHSDPLFSGEQLYAIDAISGTELWSINGFFLGVMPIADGYLIGHNGYDNQIYCFGKGETAVTVTAPLTSVPKGTTVLIQGTVTDQSSGAEGTPAVADEYMSEWMEYLYMQQECPADYRGVPVKLEAFGSDGSYTEIGTVTSDAYGNFKVEWTPEDEGLYTIMATFAGSDSYYSSYDATGLSIGSWPTPEEPETEEAPLFTTAELAILAAVIILIIIALIGIIVLRK